jgi:hypothetical protein
MTLTENQKYYFDSMVEFIYARLEEERLLVQDAYNNLDEWTKDWSWGRVHRGTEALANRDGTRTYLEPSPSSRLINRFGPERVLAEIGLKHRLATQARMSDDVTTATYILRPMAEIWDKHPDFGKDWHIA